MFGLQSLSFHPDNTRISAARSRQCFASFNPWSVIGLRSSLPNRRERTLSLSHRRPWFIGVFSAGDVLRVFLPAEWLLMKF